jgi:hypothetical protein
MPKWLPPRGFTAGVHELDARCLGWRGSLARLAARVEPEIQD